MRDGDGATIKVTTCIIIIGTIMISSYYALVPYIESPEKIDQMALELDMIQEGLTYDKFVVLDKSSMMPLVEQMSFDIRLLIIEEAKLRYSIVNEELYEITKVTADNDVKFIQTAEFSSAKGNNVSGKAVVVKTEQKQFLGLDDFNIINGPALHIYLTKDGNIEQGIDVGKLKGTQGTQYYEITGVNTNEFNTVVVYSVPFDIFFATATLPESI